MRRKIHDHPRPPIPSLVARRIDRNEGDRLADGVAGEVARAELGGGEAGDGAMEEMSKISQTEAKELRRRVRDLIKTLREHTICTANTIAMIDAEMKKPADNERGKRIAKILNRLEFTNDSARHFQLGEKFPLKKPVFPLSPPSPPPSHAPRTPASAWPPAPA